MRFLRMLTNSLLAGAFGAAYLTIIVLQLNPDVPLLSSTPWWWEYQSRTTLARSRSAGRPN